MSLPPRECRSWWSPWLGPALISLGLVFGGCNGARVDVVSPEEYVARFTDATEAAGIAFRQSDGGCGLHYFVEQVTAGCAFIDANGDGWLDIYFPQPKKLGECVGGEQPQHRLYINTGKGGFILNQTAFAGDPTTYGIAAAVGDYDNDGWEDLYVVGYGGNHLFRNRGDGTFQDVTVAAGVGAGGFCTGAVWFDYDRDGWLDLYVTRYCEWTPETDIACLQPNGERDVCSPNYYMPAPDVLYHNEGDGSFTDATAAMGLDVDARRGLGLAAVDLNDDGWLDLFVANDQSANYVFQNKAGKAFEDIAMQTGAAFGLTGRAQANMGVAVGDYQEDGDLDVLVTTFANEPFTLYRNDGAYFTDVSATAGIDDATRISLAFGTGFLDVLNRGRLDLFFANGHVSPFAHLQHKTFTYKQANQLLLSDGADGFTEAVGVLPPDDVRVHRGMIYGDYDNDGRIDILVTALDDRPTLLHNESTGGNWLLVRLRAASGCVTPVGAKCIAKIGDRRITRWLLGGTSYAGESDRRIHFGLGSARRIDELEIHWPSGVVQTQKNVRVNQIIEITERP